MSDSSVKNCGVYASKGECEECDLGYYLTGNACKSIPVSNCAIAETGGTTCKACYNNILVTNGTCTSSSTCSQDNCSICTTSSCLKCKSGYSVNSTGSCVTAPTSGCLFTSSVANTCTICSKGYYMSNNTCKSTTYTSSANIYASIFVLAVMCVLRAF